MHEVSVMQSALQVALEQAGREGAARIHRVGLRIGALSGVVPEAIEFAFDLVVRGTIAEGADLELEAVPVSCSCKGCGLEFHPDELCFECPRCLRPDASLLRGRELELAFLEVS